MFFFHDSAREFRTKCMYYLFPTVVANCESSVVPTFRQHNYDTAENMVCQKVYSLRRRVPPHDI